MLTIFNLTRGFLLRIPWISSIGLALHRFVGSVNVAIRLPLLIVDVWNSTSVFRRIFLERLHGEKKITLELVLLFYFINNLFIYYLFFLLLAVKIDNTGF